MEKPPSVYYRVNDLAKEWGWDVSNILHYGGTGELQLCLLVPNQTLMEPIWRLGLNSIPIKYPSSDRAHVVDDAFGHLYFNIRLIENSEPIPISKEDALKIRTAGLSLRETICYNLVVYHEEKLRFKPARDLANSDDIGEKERTTWLKIIYLLIRRLAEPSGVNFSQLEPILKKEAKKYGLKPHGLSDSNLTNIYYKAVSELNVVDPSPQKIKLKKITK